MNLENLGVQEMNAQEVKNVDGGIIPLLIGLAWGAVGVMVYGGVGAASFDKGYEDGQK